MSTQSVSNLSQELAAQKVRVLKMCMTEESCFGEAVNSQDGFRKSAPLFAKVFDSFVSVLGAGSEFSNARSINGRMQKPEECSGSDITVVEKLRHLYYVYNSIVLCTGSPNELGRLEGSSLLDHALADVVLLTLGNKGTGPIEHVSSSQSLQIGFFIHEMRNGLSNAMLAHQLMLSGTPYDKKRVHAILSGAHQQMKAIIDGAMAEHSNGGVLAVRPSKFRLQDFLEQIVAGELLAAGERKVAMTVSVDPLIEVWTDLHHLTCAFSNLVKNAIKFTRSRTQVRVRGFFEDGRVVLEVEDRCGGLPIGTPEELFEPYVQLSEDRSGSGLGLSIARRAATVLGGTISCRSLPGTGCVFRLSVPDVLASQAIPMSARATA